MQTQVATKQKQLDSANRQLYAERVDVNKGAGECVSMCMYLKEAHSIGGWGMSEH